MLNKMIILNTIAATCLIAATGASAAVDGAYIGGQLGYGYTHQFVEIKKFPDVNDNDFKDSGIAGRAFVGYQFNKNFAAETGYTRFSNAKVRGTTFKIETQALDVVGKGILPLDNNVSIYGKLGAAYVNEKASEDNYPSEKRDRVYPTFGAGISYDINTNVSTDFSWSHIQKVGANDNALKNTDFFGLGLSYHFG